MPGWLINVLIKLATIVGVPLLKKMWPNVGAEVWAIIVDFLTHVQSSEDKPDAVRQVGEKVRECTGSMCPANTKGLG